VAIVVIEQLKTFGAALRYARQAAQLTQGEFASAVGYGREQISRLETGQRVPDLHVVQGRMLEVLGLDLGSTLAQHLMTLAARSLEPTQPEQRDAGLPVADLSLRLPEALTRFVGRTAELQDGLRLLEQTRLLVLVGAGGMGKTRLAYVIAGSIAAHSDTRVIAVELAPITDAMRLADHVAAVLQLLPSQGLSAEQQIVDHLQGSATLLVLDNCEHLLMAAAHLSETLLRACPRLRILATSRTAFGTLSALTWRIPPLRSVDALELFADRARQANHRFALTPQNTPIITTICARLDSMPLAIELVAVRVRVLSSEQIAERLSDRLDLLGLLHTSTVPRQQTLRAMIDWSYALLSEDERSLLRRLAVFVGGWTLEAAEAIAAQQHMSNGLALLTSLVDQSMVIVDDSTEDIRYTLLESIREYTYEKLQESGEAVAAHDTHLEYMVALLARGEPELRTSQQQRWYARFVIERENIRTALNWAIQTANKQYAVRMIATMWFYWFWRGHWAEGTRWAHNVFALPGDAEPLWYSRALVLAASLPGRMGDFTTFAKWLQLGMQLNDPLNDTATMAWARISASYLEPDPERAIELNEEALRLARAAGDHWNAGNILYNLGDRFRGARNDVRASELYRMSIEEFRLAGDQDTIAFPIGNLGRIAFANGDDAAAQLAFEESIAIAAAAGNAIALADWQIQLARIAVRRGDAAQATAALTQSMQTYLDMGNLEAVADALVIAADVRRQIGLLEQAATLLGTATRLYDDFHVRRDLVEGANSEYLAICIQQVQLQLDGSAFIHAWEYGRRLDARAAVAIAMQPDVLYPQIE
jgi:predicted ATPase/DNA-binding XRE family transcriptional regulator